VARVLVCFVPADQGTVAPHASASPPWISRYMPFMCMQVPLAIQWPPDWTLVPEARTRSVAAPGRRPSHRSREHGPCAGSWMVVPVSAYRVDRHRRGGLVAVQRGCVGVPPRRREWRPSVVGSARVLQVSGGEWHPEASIYLVISCVILAGLLVSYGTDSGRRIPDRRSAANGLLAMVVAAAIVLALPWWRSWAAGGATTALLTDAPEPVSTALAGLTRPGDRIFAPQPWGSWLELAVPSRLVAVDSRVELFPPAVWDDYGAVSSGSSNWSMVLDRWSVQAVVARPDQQAGLLPLISQDPRWRLAFRDATASVFVRR